MRAGSLGDKAARPKVGYGKGQQTPGETEKVLQPRVKYHALSYNHNKRQPFSEQRVC